MLGSTKAAVPAAAKKPAAAPEIAAAAAAAAAAGKNKTTQRRRRREKAELRDHGFEYMDLGDDLDSGPRSGFRRSSAVSVASDRGARDFGFTGAANGDDGVATGLTTLAGDEFGGGPAMPMLPGTWSRDPHREPDAD